MGSGHEELDVLVRLDSPAALLVTLIHDLWPQNGCVWIARDEVLGLEQYESGQPVVRVADRTGARRLRAGSEFEHLPRLFTRLGEAAALAGVYSRSTGSREILVGAVSSVGAEEVSLREVSPDGTDTGDQLVYRYADIAGVEWATDYLRALALLADV